VTRTSQWLTLRLEALRAAAPNLILAALAATLSWFIAKQAFSDRTAFFAPVATILTLGLTTGQRGRRAFEIALGVTLGIGIADLLVLILGSGTWQLAVIVLLAMSAAVLAGGGVLLVNQAAVSAVLVVTLSAQNGFNGTRVLDALIGSAIALLATALLPSNPMRMVREQSEPLLRGFARALEMIAAGLERHDIDLARDALHEARSLEPQIATLREALVAGHETTVLAPTRRQDRALLDPYGNAADQIDYAVRNTRVLARRAISAIEIDDRVPVSVLVAIRELAKAVPHLSSYLSDPGSIDEVEREVLAAAASATAALEVTGNLSANVIVGQVRAIAVDLLGALGIGGDEAREAVRGARARALADRP
jgi:uncharacterized membrane protein YgaE (UPF0421/DUF939 family)